MSDVVRRWVENVLSRPDEPAIHTRRRTVTYRELETRAGEYLEAISAVAGTEPVQIMCADPVETVAATLAATAAGRAFAPVDVRTPAARITQSLDMLRPGILIVDDHGATALEKADPPGCRVLLARDLRRGRFDLGRWDSAAEVDRGYVYFTSGSTGRPKGVRGSLEAIEHFVAWEIEEFGVGPGTRVSSLTSPGFDAFLRDAFVPLCSGGTMCVAPRTALTAQGLARWLESSGVRILHCVPTVFRTLRASDLTSTSLAELRTVLLAGEPLRAADIRWWRALFGEEKELVNLYGPTETTMTKLFHRITAEDAAADRVPVGRPMPGVRATLLPTGEVELHVPFPLPGYLGDDQGGFDPADPHRFRTGDLGRFRPDGTLEILGRRDRQVKVRGVRVELDDVANVLLRHPAVHDVYVVVRGEDAAATLCAYVVGSADRPADRSADREEKDLLRYLREHLPPGMVPATVVTLPALPRTLSGKVDESRLPPDPAMGAS